MNTSQMKNIIVLKDLPSNIIDEAIVILKNNSKIKKKEKIENKLSNDFSKNSNSDYDFAIKEAEYVIADYINEIEKSKEKRKHMNKKSKKICGFVILITMIIGIIINIVV